MRMPVGENNIQIAGWQRVVEPWMNKNQAYQNCVDSCKYLIYDGPWGGPYWTLSDSRFIRREVVCNNLIRVAGNLKAVTCLSGMYIRLRAAASAPAL